MRESRLAVITYPETAFVEALTMNVPTIGLWPDRLFELRDSVRPTFDALRAAGMVFHDAGAAARHVESVYGQADAWWRDPTIQAVRRQFLNRFGLSARGWRGPWVRYLRELAAARPRLAASLS
jgi:putative transferase (TIGR04331 family)